MTCAGATNLVDQYLTCMSKAGLNNVAHGQAVGPSQIDPACEIIGGQAKSVISQVNSQAELVKSSIPKGPCAKSLFDFQADLASHTYLFVAPTSFDPATEYNLPTGSTFAKWDPRDYSCIFPSHKELDDATVVPSAYLLDPKVQSALANQGNPTETCVPAPPVTDCPSAAGPSTMMAHHHGGNSIGLPSPAPGLPMQTTSSSSTTPFYSENFDSGSASGWSLSGLWHPSSCQAVSGGYSLGYNQPGCPTNYDVGTTAGEAISPPISIPSDSSSVVLSWNSWHQTESGTYWDTKIVYVSMDGSAFQQLDQEDGTQQAWNAKTKDLSAYVGHTIQIKFVFKSGDDLYNDGQGWFIDDVLVSGVTGVPSNQGGYIPADLFFENFDQALPGSWSYSGLWTLNLCQSVSQPWSMVYSTRPGYGRDCPKNFDVGTTAGNAITSTISVPSGSTNVRLSWRSWHDTESGTSYDQKKVFVSSDGGASWAQVWQEDGTQQVWNSRSVDLSSYAGTNILVKFSFDSVDGLYNQGEGWSVDDVKITASVPSNDHCPGSSYYFPRGLAGMCTNVRAGPSGGPITLSVLVPNWGDSQATDTSNPCQYDHAREAADYLQITSVQFNVICVFGWNTEQTAGFGYPYSDDDCAWSSGTSGAYSSDGYSEDAHTLLNRAFHYAKWNGLIDQPNQAVLAWVHEATSAGMACPWSFPWAVALAAERADYCFNGSCNTFPLTGLALHEVAHLFAAAHSPADDWRKYDCNQGDGVMNYCDMAFGARNFTQEGLERVANNIIDDAP
jgi:hypothetical protein